MLGVIRGVRGELTKFIQTQKKGRLIHDSRTLGNHFQNYTIKNSTLQSYVVLDFI